MTDAFPTSDDYLTGFIAGQRAVEAAIIHLVADYVESWGGAPASPYGRRKQLAEDIRSRKFEQEVTDAARSSTG